MWNESIRQRLQEELASSQNGGGAERIEKQHASGKMTARERLEFLFDAGTFVEVGGLIRSRRALGERKEDTFPCDGVVTGYGLINGRTVFAASQDFTVNGGTLGEKHSQKICRIMDMALDAMAPFISINDSGGARIEEGINSLAGYSGIFLRNTHASGVIPQIAVILGPCAGGACYSPAICDFIFMTENTSKMFITGPAVVKAVVGEDTTADALGGAAVHAANSGVAHFVYPDDTACLQGVRELLTYLPINNMTPPEASSDIWETGAVLEDIVPDNMRLAYDVREVIGAVADADSFFEVQAAYAKNIVVGFARLNGEVLGIVANQPKVFAGSLDVDASDKAARFVRFCDCFGIPVLSLVDVPGYMPGTKQEHAGIIRHGAKLLYAYSEATVPKVSVILRKAYGGAYIAMNSKNMGADAVYAWPIAQLAVMGAEGAVDIIYKKQIRASEDPEALRKQLISEYEAEYLNPYIAAENGYIDEIILPAETRARLIQIFAALRAKKKQTLWKKHGNIPL